MFIGLSFLGNFHFMNDYIIKFVLYRFEINGAWQRYFSLMKRPDPKGGRFQ